jgi:siroheme synthase (precorrin-2 oxidase/ferrochelatase)
LKEILSQWLGTDLDYSKIKIYGREALDDLKKGKYTESLIDQLYRLDDAKIGNTKKTFYINAADFTVNRQEITQTAESRMIQVAYADNKVFTEAILPTNVTIKTFQPKV